MALLASNYTYDLYVTRINITVNTCDNYSYDYTDSNYFSNLFS